MEKYLACYFAVISLVSVIFTIIDKKLAIKEKRRVSEKTLFILAGLGGSLAMFITMKKIRHKTRKRRFMIGLPIIFMLQVAILFFIFYNGGQI